MRAYIFAFLLSFFVALLFGTGWYALFGYETYHNTIDNLLKIYQNISFWKGVGIWTVLYALFFAFPIVFLKNRSYSESK